MPTQPGFDEPPKGIVFKERVDLARLAPLVAEVVGSGFMPRRNATLMTDAERVRVVEWAEG